MEWKKSSNTDFNFYYNGKKSETDFLNLKEQLLKTTGNIVINAGHFIPDINNPNKIGKNPLKTWDMACFLSSVLLKDKRKVNLTLLINDLPLTIEQREKISFKLAKPYLKILKKYQLSESIVLYDSVNKNQLYAEKRLANRIDYLLRKTKRMSDYTRQELDNYCKLAIVGYLQDIKKQGAKISVWIAPKCSHKNLIEAVEIFNKAEDGLSHFLYFETLNCFL
jgi:hypothetical protein